MIKYKPPIYFWSMIIAILVAFWFYNRIFVTPPKSEQMENLNYTFKNHDYNDVVFIGSSRVLRQINPHIVDSIAKIKSYNLGIDQIGIIESKMLLKSYLIHHPKPKAVFLNIDLSTFMFNTNSTGPYNINEYFSFLNDTLIYNELAKYNYRYRYNSIFEKWYNTKPFWKLFTISDADKKNLFFNKTIKSDLSFQKQILKNKGFIVSDRKWNIEANTELFELNTQVLKEIPVTEQGLDLLRDFIEICNKSQVKCILIFVPWLNKVNKNPNHNQVLNEVKKISNNKKAIFWNFSKISMADSTAYFYDVWHFNKLGSTKYSSILAEDIKKLNF